MGAALGNSSMTHMNSGAVECESRLGAANS